MRKLFESVAMLCLCSIVGILTIMVIYTAHSDRTANPVTNLSEAYPGFNDDTDYPPPVAMRMPTALPTPTYPLPTAFPTVFPSLKELPEEGLKALFYENRPESINVWMAMVPDVHQRKLVFSLPRKTADSIGLSLSHNHTKIAYTKTRDQHPDAGEYGAELWIFDVESQEHKQIASGVRLGRYIHYPLWSPDDQFVAFELAEVINTTNNRISVMLYDLDSQKARVVSSFEYSNKDGSSISNMNIIDWLKDRLMYAKYTGDHMEIWQVSPYSMSNNAEVVYSDNGKKSMDAFRYCIEVNQQSKNAQCYSIEKNGNKSAYLIDMDSGKLSRIVSDMHGAMLIQDDIATVVVDNNISSYKDGSQILVFDAQLETSFVPHQWSPDGEWLAGSSIYNEETYVSFVSRKGDIVVDIAHADGFNFVSWVR